MSGAPGGSATGTPRTVVQGRRAKAYRPLPPEARAEAYRAGIAAYRRGDFFAAHEHLEPAWMGTADPAERELHQGLIKLAAGFVHAVRGNPLGVTRNLTGARARLVSARDGGAGRGVADGRIRGLDLDRLVADIDDRLSDLEAGRPVTRHDAPGLHRAPRRST